jgi:hypothetical protein
LNTKVENEETTVRQEIDVPEIEGRIKDHRQMLKRSPLSTPREKVEVSKRPPDTFSEAKPPAVPKVLPDKKTAAKPVKIKNKEVHAKTVAIAKELKLNLDKFSLDQKDLHSLISCIKELHLKRLFTEDRKEFETFSKEIKKQTLAAAKPEAQDWLTSQLDKLTHEAVEYKLRLLKSLQSMDFNAQRDNTIKWLGKLQAKNSN